MAARPLHFLFSFASLLFTSLPFFFHRLILKARVSLLFIFYFFLLLPPPLFFGKKKVFASFILLHVQVPLSLCLFLDSTNRTLPPSALRLVWLDAFFIGFSTSLTQ